jgi:hypothetical protein
LLTLLTEARLVANPSLDEPPQPRVGNGSEYAWRQSSTVNTSHIYPLFSKSPEFLLL